MSFTIPAKENLSSGKKLMCDWMEASNAFGESGSFYKIARETARIARIDSGKSDVSVAHPDRAAFGFELYLVVERAEEDAGKKHPDRNSPAFDAAASHYLLEDSLGDGVMRRFRRTTVVMTEIAAASQVTSAEEATAERERIWTIAQYQKSKIAALEA